MTHHIRKNINIKSINRHIRDIVRGITRVDRQKEKRSCRRIEAHVKPPPSNSVETERASYRSWWIDGTSNPAARDGTRVKKSNEWYSRATIEGSRILHCSRINESSRRRPSKACLEVLEPVRARRLLRRPGE